MTTMNNNTVNPFGIFEDADIKEQKVTGPVKQRINLVKAREEAELCNLIGRGENVSMVIVDKKNIGKLKAHARSVIKGNFSNYMLKAMTSLIKKFIENGTGVSFLTTSNNAITMRMYRKYSSMADVLDVDSIMASMTTKSRFYNIEVDDTQEMIATKKESAGILREFVETMVEADAKGIYVEANKVDEFNQLVLNVPEGIELKAGDVLKFENGYTADGISVQGWKNFSREKATVQQKTVNGRLVYFLYKKNKERFTSLEQVMHDVIGKQWAECPAVVATVDMDSCEETMFSLDI